ncbi:hypothetical protein B296_00002992 [Ensete ventricosum]|uniref:Uncharacterized protein n=1 Tax=Ensete ventricosum TaxID=4639 RepID=A0A427AT34_ENSVE|nr:hypothetical protein B296_00002992 [Ensete ventricosum]
MGMTWRSVATYRTKSKTLFDKDICVDMSVSSPTTDPPGIPYNVIIGRPTLNRLKATVSTYHRIMKFLTRAGVGEARSDPGESRQCYLTTMTLPKRLKVPTTTTGPQSPDRDTQDPDPKEQALEVPLDLTQLDKMVKVDLGLLEEQQIQLV